MPRSSRHKSHRAHKHGPRDARDRSESDEDGGSRDRKQRAEELVTRVSRDPEPEKRKSLSSSQIHRVDTDQVCPDGGDCSVEDGKKRKDKVDDLVVTDRWVGGGEEDGVFEKRPKSEAFGAVDSDKAAKSKLLPADSKGRSSRRREGSTERHDETRDTVEPPKHRSEKDSTKRESSGQYKDVKEKDRERGLERDKNVRNSRNERSDDISSKNQNVKTGADREVKKDKENTEWKIQDELRNPELEKELEKRVRRRDGSEDKDKWHGDGRESDDRRHRESDDRRLSSRDDHTKNGSYRDERHKDERNRDGRYSRDKYREDLDRDHRHRDDRHRDEKSTRNHGSDRNHSKHRKDDKSLESGHKKSKLQDSDHNGVPHVDDHGNKFKDTRGRKRTCDENEEHRDLKLQCTKQPRGEVEKNTSNTSVLDSHMDRARSEYRHPDKVDCSFSDNRPKSLTSSSSHTVKDQCRYSSKQGEFTCRESFSQGRSRSNAAFIGDHANVSGGRERDSESRSQEKTKPKERINSGDLLTEIAAASQYDRTPRSDGQIALIGCTEKSPSSTSDRRCSNKSGARRSLDIDDMGQISSTPKDRRDCSSIDTKEHQDNHSQKDLQNSHHIHVGSSSFSRPGHLSGSSPGHLHLPPIRPNSPSVLGSFEEDSRYQSGDRISSSRYKRSGDYNTGRAQGNAWRSTSPWPPVANGFIPFQHGPPPPGFHTAIQQFPFPSLFGMRPPMDMNHPGVSYNPHEAADRFSGHGRPFGWRSPMVDSFQQLQGWDRSNGVFGDESHVYGRPEWDQNRHLMGGRGWEINAGMWKAQNGQVNMEFPVPQKEPDYMERDPSESLPDERTEIKPSNDTPSTEHTVQTPPKTIHEKANKPCKATIDDGARICCTYLSNLDISLDLTCPELYKQCVTLLGTSAPPGECSFPKHGFPQNVKEGTEAAAKSSNKILNRLFPKETDAVFQRAMLVYKKQNEATKVKVPTLLVSSMEENSPESPDTEEVKAADYETSEYPNASSATNMEEEVHTIADAKADAISEAVVFVEGLSTEEKNPPEAADTENAKVVDYQTCEETSQPNADSDTNMEEEGGAITDAGAGVPSDDAKEQQSDLVYDAVVLVEGSEECEAIMPECAVDLSRIPNSPESTH